MPEGDTVHLAVARLNDALAATRLTHFDLRVPRYATADLTGEQVLEVVARGKHQLFRFSGGMTLHTHFKMEGSWHLYAPRSPWKGRAFEVRAVLANESYVAVGFRLAQVELLATRDEASAVGHLGPDPLAPDWDRSEALRRVEAAAERPLGEVLLDQTVMAGPGNVYRCEIAFLLGVHPAAPVRAVDDLEALVDLTADLLERNRTTGRQITTGDPRPGRARFVYGRGGRPCRRCRTPIRRAEPSRGGEQVLYWCPRCQTLPEEVSIPGPEGRTPAVPIQRATR